MVSKPSTTMDSADGNEPLSESCATIDTAAETVPAGAGIPTVDDVDVDDDSVFTTSDGSGGEAVEEAGEEAGEEGKSAKGAATAPAVFGPAASFTRGRTVRP